MTAKEVTLKVGQSVTMLTGITYSIERVTKSKVFLMRDGMITSQAVSPELVKLCVAKATR